MYVITDVLNATKVEQLWQTRTEIFQHDSVDLSQVAKIDSAGISFLVLWARQQKDGILTVKSMPEDAVHLVQLFKVAQMFRQQ